MASYSSGKQTAWDSLLRTEVPILAANRVPNTDAECFTLYNGIMRGPGDWEPAVVLKTLFQDTHGLTDRPAAGSRLYNTRYVGRDTQGQEVYAPTSFNVYTITGGTTFSYEAPSVGVLSLWSDLCRKVDVGISVFQQREGDQFRRSSMPAIISYFRIMSALIHLFDDGQGRLANAWSVMQFKRNGWNLRIPLAGNRFNIPDSDPLAAIEQTAVITFMNKHGLPYLYRERFYDLKKREGEEELVLNNRILPMPKTEYQARLFAALNSEIAGSHEFISDTFLEYCRYSGLQMLSWVLLP